MIKLSLDGLPPSSNHAYFNLPKGGRALTREGKKYINETKTHFVQAFPRQMTFFKPNRPYLVAIRFYFKEVENAGWFKGKADSRYKKLDVGNRLKLLEDCLKDAAGTDDSQHFRIVLDKQQGKERTEIWVWDLEEEETPFDSGFIRI